MQSQFVGDAEGGVEGPREVAGLEAGVSNSAVPEVGADVASRAPDRAAARGLPTSSPA